MAFVVQFADTVAWHREAKAVGDLRQRCGEKTADSRKAFMKSPTPLVIDTPLK